MPGIFGDLFDFDGDGKLDCVEQAAELITFKNTIKEERINDDGFSDEDD